MTDELDPAAIMAAHPQRACFHPDGWYCGKCHDVAPCLPYRLAAGWIDAERRGAEKGWDEGREVGYERAQVEGEIWVTDDDPNPYRSDGIAQDQP